MSITLPISLVIATTGGQVLRDTLNSINSGSHIPSEIIICLPPGVEIDSIKHVNVRIINSISRGQVAQRTHAFDFCRHDHVMQSDDDILYDKCSIFKLYNAILKLPIDSVVGPIFYDDISKENVVKYPSLFKRLYDLVVLLSPLGLNRMGKLTNAGFGLGVSDLYLDKSTAFPVDWLPGGCVMSHKSSLIKYNYYPYKGKAYAEDIINSVIRKRNNINHYVIPSSLAYLISNNINNNVKFSEVFKIIKAQHYVVKMINGNIISLLLWSAIFLVKTFFLKLINRR